MEIYIKITLNSSHELFNFLQNVIFLVHFQVYKFSTFSIMLTCNNAVNIHQVAKISMLWSNYINSESY